MTSFLFIFPEIDLSVGDVKVFFNIFIPLQVWIAFTQFLYSENIFIEHILAQVLSASLQIYQYLKRSTSACCFDWNNHPNRSCFALVLSHNKSIFRVL